MLRVIDISTYQADLDLHAIADQFDAVMIKATGGNGYVNPHCDMHVQQAIALGKKWGVYHYFSDGYNDSNAIAEAEWFLSNCQGYVGKGILCLDWERGGNPDVNNPNMARQFTQHVKSKTNVNMMDYMSLSLVNSMDWSGSISDGNSLWCAAYIDDNTPIANFAMDPKRDPSPKWDGNVGDIMWQFTSTGRLTGYGGNLDCSFFYGNSATWDAYAGTYTAQAPETTTTTTTAPAPVEVTTTTTTVVPTTDNTTDTQPETATTTTTTTTQIEQPAQENKQTFWQSVVAVLIVIIKRLRGIS